MQKFRLILASSSVSRASVLNKLSIPYEKISPDIDESPKAGERAHMLVTRLAIEKAEAVAKSLSPSDKLTLIIGSDQVAAVNGQFVSKPENHEDAVRQLQAVRNRSIEFYTGLCLLNATTGKTHSIVDPFTVTFRDFSDQDIESYLQKEKPYSCAGSLRCEGLGIALIKEMRGKDPNTLIGLPLIDLITLLRYEGVWVLNCQ